MLQSWTSTQSREALAIFATVNIHLYYSIAQIHFGQGGRLQLQPQVVSLFIDFFESYLIWEVTYPIRKALGHLSRWFSDFSPGQICDRSLEAMSLSQNGIR